MTISILTAPRPKKNNHLYQTTTSILSEISKLPKKIQKKFKIQIVNHFGNIHQNFYKLKTELKKSTIQIEFIEKAHQEFYSIIEQQRNDVLSILREVDMNYKYLLLLEDDFPICKNQLQNILLSLCHIESIDKKSCGLFTGMGGSGIIFNIQNSLVRLKKELFLNPIYIHAHDIQIQLCLDGTLCKKCKHHFYISPSLYFFHIGYDTSTYRRKQKKSSWQCGWRHVYTNSKRAKIIDKIHFQKFNWTFVQPKPY
eukprot:gene9638-1842_t